MSEFPAHSGSLRPTSSIVPCCTIACASRRNRVLSVPRRYRSNCFMARMPSVISSRTGGDNCCMANCTSGLHGATNTSFRIAVRKKRERSPTLPARCTSGHTYPHSKPKSHPTGRRTRSTWFATAGCQSRRVLQEASQLGSDLRQDRHFKNHSCGT